MEDFFCSKQRIITMYCVVVLHMWKNGEGRRGGWGRMQVGEVGVPHTV